MKKAVLISALLALVYAYYKYKSKVGLLLGKISKKPPKVELKYSKNLKPEERPLISSSNDAVKVFRGIWSDQIEVREEFVVLLLDRSNRVLGYHLLSRGGISATIVDVKILFSLALESLASGIIMAHNHPSGKLKPSMADKKVTHQIMKASRPFELPLLDHIILTKESYYSFADNGDL